MPVHKVIKDYAEDALPNLKKVVASRGKRLGLFCLVKGQNAGESGLAVVLKKSEGSIGLVKTAGKALRRASSGNRLCIGSVVLDTEKKKLVFRITDGALTSKAAQLTLKNDFNSDEFSGLGSLLKRAVVVKGEEQVVETTSTSADEVIEDDYIEDMRQQLLATSPPGEVDLLNEVFDAAADEMEKSEEMESLFVDILAIDDTDPDPEEAQQAVIEIYSVLYSEGFYNRDQLMSLCQKLTRKNVDLSAFENAATVGSLLPEPMRSQILLAGKLMAANTAINRHLQTSDLPTVMVQLQLHLFATMTEQNDLISAGLIAKYKESQQTDKAFQKISEKIQQDLLFRSFRKPISKAISAIETNPTTATSKQLKSINQALIPIDELEKYILSSLKIQGCDNYLSNVNIRSSLLPILRQMRTACESTRTKLEEER